jgi:hypothetical protein
VNDLAAFILHFRGVRAEDIAAILVRETLRDRR